MADIKSITLTNFKGAKEVSIEIGGKNISPVTTLIGLNESGKTTVLEGISHFVTEDESVSSLFDGAHSRSNAVGLIPVHRKAAFTDSILITGEITITNEDTSF